MSSHSKRIGIIIGKRLRAWVLVFGCSPKSAPLIPSIKSVRLDWISNIPSLISLIDEYFIFCFWLVGVVSKRYKRSDTPNSSRSWDPRLSFQMTGCPSYFSEQKHRAEPLRKKCSLSSVKWGYIDLICLQPNLSQFLNQLSHLLHKCNNWYVLKALERSL